MDLSHIVLTIGARAFTLGEILLAGAVLFAASVLIALWLSARAAEARRRALELQLAEMAGQLHSMADQANSGQAHLARSIDERLDQVSQRLGLGLHDQSERTSQSLQTLYERLAVIDRAQANLAQLSSEMVSLKDILANKQARGAYGQGRMEAIIRDGLHSKAYAFQSTLSNGTRPDCVISLPDSALRLVIDAKFPLESYNALKKLKDDLHRPQAEQRLRTDIMKHVKDIAEKYLIQGETHETAIMFVPSESIYAELHEHFEDLIQRAHRSRVILASPNVLLLLVQTLQTIVKDATMREQAHVIKGEVARMLDDVNRLKERTGDLRRHFDMANADIDKIVASSDKISKRGIRIENLDVTEDVAGLSTSPKPRLVASGE